MRSSVSLRFSSRVSLSAGESEKNAISLPLTKAEHPNNITASIAAIHTAVGLSGDEKVMPVSANKADADANKTDDIEVID